MKTAEDLKQLLINIDRKGYPAYKSAKGIYRFPGYLLSIDHVQGDPFAAPSSLHIEVDGQTAGFPRELYDKKEKKIALQDHILRLFATQAGKFSFQAKGSGKSGILSVSGCGQEVLERSACELKETSGSLIVRFEVGFPANGRTINARELIRILFDFLPRCIERSLYYRNIDPKKAEQVKELAVDQQFIRDQLKAQGLMAFIADGSILPRESGISQKPMQQAVAFKSPESLKVTMQLPYKGVLQGMGIPSGITLIVGGGYHGKSTLLKALEMGIYPHIAGDGREYVVTDTDALKIRAEDGRSIKHTDISMFINDLPNGKDTKAFYTEDASGSTSQAANVVEGMEAGASAFLIDEDTSATNFMVRDDLMQKVIHREMEPITPLIERMREIYETQGISTILVAGSSGAYFEVADQIIQMDHYVPKDITRLAKDTAKEYPGLEYPQKYPQEPDYHRYPQKNKDIYYKGRIKTRTLGRDGFQIGKETVDLRYVEQLADTEQLTCLGAILKYMEEKSFQGRMTVQEEVEQCLGNLQRYGFSSLYGNDGSVGNVPGNLAMPRKEEIFACINRYRGLKL